MGILKLEANYRSDMSRSRMKAVRQQGFVTGSIFGHGEEPVSVEVDLADLAGQIKASEAGMTSLIEMKIKGGPAKSDGTVIIKTFSKDPLTRKVLDIQFQRVFMKEKMHVKVPIVLLGEPAGAITGGTLEQQIDQLEVNCLPGNIPSKIEIDVSGLGIGDHIRVGDVAVPESVEFLADADVLICTCVAPHVTPQAEADEATAAAEGTPAEA